jgi:hypothetical protein
VQHRHDRITREWPFPSDAFEQQHADSEEIRALIDRLAQQLLRRHVLMSTHDSAAPGQRQLCLHRAGVDLPRKAEIEQLHTVRREEHIRWLHVSVHEAAAVQQRQRRQNRRRRLDRLDGRERSTFQTGRERLPLEQLHGDERLTRRFADFVNLTDVWMVHLRERARFSLEPVHRARIVYGRSQRLDRDLAPEFRVVSAIDETHAAAAKQAFDSVAAQDRTCLHNARGSISGRLGRIRECLISSRHRGETVGRRVACEERFQFLPQGLVTTPRPVQKSAPLLDGQGARVLVNA